jgi:hypothetical protein
MSVSYAVTLTSDCSERTYDNTTRRPPHLLDLHFYTAFESWDFGKSCFPFNFAVCNEDWKLKHWFWLVRIAFDLVLQYQNKLAFDRPSKPIWLQSQQQLQQQLLWFLSFSKYSECQSAQAEMLAELTWLELRLIDWLIDYFDWLRRLKIQRCDWLLNEWLGDVWHCVDSSGTTDLRWEIGEWAVK